MSDVTTLQVFGVPVIAYGLVGITTAVLAYATSIGGMGDALSKSAESLTSLTGNPASILGSATESPAPAPAPAPETPAPEEKPATEEPQTAGKRRRRKTPKSKRKKNRSRTRK